MTWKHCPCAHGRATGPTFSMIIPRFQTLQLCLHIPKTLHSSLSIELELEVHVVVFRQNNSQTLSSLSGFVDMHKRNSQTLSNAPVLLAKHSIPPNPHASFRSQRRYFFLATKSQSTRQIFFSNGGTTCDFGLPLDLLLFSNAFFKVQMWQKSEEYIPK